MVTGGLLTHTSTEMRVFKRVRVFDPQTMLLLQNVSFVKVLTCLEKRELCGSATGAMSVNTRGSQ